MIRKPKVCERRDIRRQEPVCLPSCVCSPPLRGLWCGLPINAMVHAVSLFSELFALHISICNYFIISNDILSEYLLFSHGFAQGVQIFYEFRNAALAGCIRQQISGQSIKEARLCQKRP